MSRMTAEGAKVRPDCPRRTGPSGVARLPASCSRELAAVGASELDGPDVVVFCGLPLFHVNAQIGTGLSLWALRPGINGQPERWLNTGDLGRVDGDGYFWLTGRQNELIILPWRWRRPLADPTPMPVKCLWSTCSSALGVRPPRTS